MPDAAQPWRVLVYTHNSIGLGHAVRTMAVIDGLRAALPGAEFLVLSGGYATQMLLHPGVEVVKLPSLRHDLGAPGQPFTPRYLKSLSRDQVLSWRRAVIAESLTAFAPRAVIIEHSLAGLMGEAAPLLASCRTLRPDGHALFHLSRGIYREKPMLLAPSGNYPGLPPGTKVTGLYDAFHVLEDRAVVDVNREFFGNDPALEEKIRYLGRVTARNIEELHQDETLRQALLPKSPFVLASLGRHGRVASMHASLFAAAARVKRLAGGEILAMLDPYLGEEETVRIKSLPHDVPVRFIPFIPGLASVMTGASLVACRAGYNTVNELLVTGAKALVVPEIHPSREQERRAQSLPATQVKIMSEAEFFAADLTDSINTLLDTAQPTKLPRLDRFAAGRRIAADLVRLAG